MLLVEHSFGYLQEHFPCDKSNFSQCVENHTELLQPFCSFCFLPKVAGEGPQLVFVFESDAVCPRVVVIFLCTDVFMENLEP